MTHKGKLIIIDGGEGAGKSTVLSFLKGKFPLGTGRGEFVFTREPGGTPVAEKIRETILSPQLKNASALTQLLNFWAARADHVEKLIRPHLEKGGHVVCDRFDSSSYAYQICAEGRREFEQFFFTIRDAVLGSTVPDLYIFLKVTPEVGLARVAKRTAETGEDQNHFDERKMDFHRKLTEGFLTFIKRFNYVVIDADQPVEKVESELINAVNACINQ